MKILISLVLIIHLQKDIKQFEMSENCRITLPFNDKIVKRLKLTQEQINIADSLINIYVKENYSRYNYTHIVDHYFDYYRQYIGYLSGETKNTIFVNAFKTRTDYMSDSLLKETLTLTKGGGSSYFTIKVNLKGMICYDFKVNAPK